MKTSVLTEFDKSLKHVKITINSDVPLGKSSNTAGPAESTNAHDVLMGAAIRQKKPAKIPEDIPRFTGERMIYSWYACSQFDALMLDQFMIVCEILYLERTV